MELEQRPAALQTCNSNRGGICVNQHWRYVAFYWWLLAVLTYQQTNSGIVSTWIFVDPPRFHTATSINLTFSLAMAAFCAYIMVYLNYNNKRKRREVERLEKEFGENGEWDSRAERRRLGDRHPRFVYTT